MVIHLYHTAFGDAILDAGRLMREGIARRARVEWQMLRGEGPPMVTLAIGEEMLLLRELERGHGLSGDNL